MKKFGIGFNSHLKTDIKTVGSSIFNPNEIGNLFHLLFHMKSRTPRSPFEGSLLTAEGEMTSILSLLDWDLLHWSIGLAI